MTAPIESALDGLAERLDEPVVRLDAGGRVVFANAAFAGVFGTAPETLDALAGDATARVSMAAALSSAVEIELPLLDARGELALVVVDPMPCGGGHVVILRPRRAVASTASPPNAASQEMRAPLNAILGFARMIARGDGGETRAENAVHARSIEAGADILIGIADELRQAGGDEPTAGTLDEGTFDLAALARAQIDLLRPAAGDAGATLLDGAAGTVAVVGDARRLARALVCLISDAIETSPPGGTIATGIDRMADGGIALWVSDGRASGPAARRAPRRTGLVRAIARRHAESHGGYLETGPIPGGGARATIRLPAARCPDAAAPGRGENA